MKRNSGKKEMGLAFASLVGMTALAGVSGPASADSPSNQPAGKYVTGDFHNHTTCSDGTLSLQKLVSKSAGTFGLDWFIQAGHGGNSARNCTLAEDPFEPVPPALNLTVPPTIPARGQSATDVRGPNQTWTSTVGNARIKGDMVGTDAARGMWKWQEIQEFIYPVIEKESRDRNKPIFVGLEQNVPGHEHTSISIIDGQLPTAGNGNATAMAKFEYCFDRNDGDTSRGANNQWDCSVPGSANNGLLDPKARKIIITGSGAGSGIGTQGHRKTVEGIKWMAANYPKTSYYVPAHLERAGAFNPDGNNGFNIEHLRDFNNAAPMVSFGFETMPGHQADPDRGSYGSGAVGGGTYGGVGVYGATIGGVWDALLGEGRNWFFFGSSDYHNRGSFGPDQRESNADFFPGEYTKDYVMARNGDQKLGTQAIVDGLRSGNSFVVNGDLIDRLSFVVCIANPGKGHAEAAADVEAFATAAYTKQTSVAVNSCATMGQKLRVNPNAELIVSIIAHDPVGTNNSPYSFPNPSLKQVGITQPLNAPVLDHIDVIGGKVTGYVSPSDTAAYAGLIGSPAASNPSAGLKKTFNASNWTAMGDGTRRMTYRISRVDGSGYLRLRGTNLPPATPYETDASGNPLLDAGIKQKIPCADSACPVHMTTVSGVKYSSFDVAAWADLWFYSNPVFIEVVNSTKVAGIN